MPTLSTPAGTLHYVASGAGPAVLLIQGVGVPGSGWDPQVADLGRDYRTLTFDNRGVGQSVPWAGDLTIESMAADARSVLDAAGVEAAHVVGHSMGGVIAQQLALDAPGRVRSLTLMCTFAQGREAARLTPWVLWMTLRTRVGSRASRRRAFLEMIHTPQELRNLDVGSRAAEIGRLFGRDLADSPAILLKQLGALRRHDASARLQALGTIPTRVVSASEDRIAPPVYGRRLASLIPGATYHEIASAAHGVTIAQPEAVNRRLREFFGVRGQSLTLGSPTTGPRREFSK